MVNFRGAPRNSPKASLNSPGRHPRPRRNSPRQQRAPSLTRRPSHRLWQRQVSSPGRPSQGWPDPRRRASLHHQSHLQGQRRDRPDRPQPSPPRRPVRPLAPTLPRRQQQRQIRPPPLLPTASYYSSATTSRTSSAFPPTRTRSPAAVRSSARISPSSATAGSSSPTPCAAPGSASFSADEQSLPAAHSCARRPSTRPPRSRKRV